MATVSFEIELELDGFVEPYRAATYWNPAEGGYVEDLDILDAGVLSDYDRERRTWKRTSFLKDVDLKNPEVRKLLDNLLQLVREDAEQAVINASLEDAA